MTPSKILFVEDDEFIRKIYTDRFLASGINAVTADTAQKAMDAFGADTFALVCTDYILPDRSGMEIVTWLRTEKQFTGPIIVLSASGQEAQIEQVMAAGATEYLQKDHTRPSELVDKIQNYLNKL